jgi:hypothetical protein
MPEFWKVLRSTHGQVKERERKPLTLKEYGDMYRFVCKVRVDTWRALADELNDSHPFAVRALLDNHELDMLASALDHEVNADNPLYRWFERKQLKQAEAPRPCSLQSLNSPKSYIRSRDGLGYTTEINSELDRKDASWYVCRGLAGGDTVSFRSVNNPKQYLRHHGGRLKLHDFVDADLFKQDASFKRINGLGKGGWVSFESVNYPGYFLRHHKDGELWVEKNDGSELFAKDATFRIVEPFYKP